MVNHLASIFARPIEAIFAAFGKLKRYSLTRVIHPKCLIRDTQELDHISDLYMKILTQTPIKL